MAVPTYWGLWVGKVPESHVLDGAFGAYRDAIVRHGCLFYIGGLDLWREKFYPTPYNVVYPLSRINTVCKMGRAGL